MTEPDPLERVARTYVRFRNRKLSFFSGCDYFRLSSDPRIKSAVETGLRKYGLNVSASRLTTGNHKVYGDLEKALKTFFGSPDALVTPAGYFTNLIAAQALAGRFSHALVDDRSHPAVSHAARFLDCPVLTFKHLDTADLEKAVQRCGPGARFLLMTDGLFSHSGAVAPLASYRKILPKDAWMLVDDAHGAGVIGATGRGTLEYAGMDRNNVIQTITLSKAFGVYGGAILSTPKFRQEIFDRSPLFVGITPSPLPMAYAAMQSVKLLRANPVYRKRLHQNASYVREQLRKAGMDVPANPGPIIPFIPKTAREASNLRTALLAEKIFPSLIRYPGGPSAGYFRFVISSEHSRSQLDSLVRAVRRVEV